MPPLKEVQGIARLACLGTLGGRTCVNVFHVGKTADLDDWSQADLATLVAAFRSSYTANFRTIVHGDMVFTDVTAVDLSSVVGKVASATGSTAGVLSGACCPNNVAVCISWKVSVHYRGGHPRTYFSGLPQANTDGHTSLLTAYRNTVIAAASAFRGDINNITIGTGKAILGSVHRRLGGIELTSPLFAPYTSSSVDDRIDSQRRRLGPDR